MIASSAVVVMARFRSLPFTPNQVTVAGLSLNGVAAVLIYQEHFVWATVAFVSRSTCGRVTAAGSCWWP